MTHKNLFIIIEICLPILFIANGCDDGGKFGTYSDEKIQTQYSNCQALKNPSRTKSIVCDNYARECRRRMANGNNICEIDTDSSQN